MFCIQSLSVHPQNTHCCPIGLDPLSLLPPTAFSLLSPSLYSSNSNQISASCSHANPKVLCLHHNMYELLHPSHISFLLCYLFLLLFFFFNLYSNNHSTLPHKPVQLSFCRQTTGTSAITEVRRRGSPQLKISPVGLANPLQIPLLLHEEKTQCLHMYCMCVRLHKQSDKAVIPALNFTKASPASTASPPNSGETKKKKNRERKERKKKRPICSTKRKHLLRHSVFHSLLSVKRGNIEERGGYLENIEKAGADRKEKQALEALKLQDVSMTSPSNFNSSSVILLFK